jgi:hypothetical protein
LAVLNSLNRAVHTIAAAWFRYKQRKVQALLAKSSGVGTTATATVDVDATAADLNVGATTPNSRKGNNSTFLPHPTSAAPSDNDALTDDDDDASFDENDD